MRKVRTRISPASAMRSICSGVFLMIKLQLLFEPQRGQRGADVVVDLVRAARAVEAAQQPPLLVVLDERGGLPMVDLQSLPDRLFLVVLALDQTRPVDVAAPPGLRRVELHVADA